MVCLLEAGRAAFHHTFTYVQQSVLWLGYSIALLLSSCLTSLQRAIDRLAHACFVRIDLDPQRDTFFDFPMEDAALPKDFDVLADNERCWFDCKPIYAFWSICLMTRKSQRPIHSLLGEVALEPGTICSTIIKAIEENPHERGDRIELVSVGGGHWTMLYIDSDSEHPSIEYYDSKRTYGNVPVLQADLTALAAELLRITGNKHIVRYPIRETIQRDSYQCGPWVCLFAKKRMEGPFQPPKNLDLAQINIAKFRRHIQHQLLKYQQGACEDFQRAIPEDLRWFAHVLRLGKAAMSQPDARLALPRRSLHRRALSE
jgi:hypothetical protein